MAAAVLMGSEGSGEIEYCLSGNASRNELNLKLRNAGYRYVWTGTNQTAFPGERYTAGWVSFAEGMLCDQQEFNLPYQSQLREKCKYTGYAWPESGYELEIDFGKVCRVTRFSLVGSKRIMVRAFYPRAKRWLCIAKGTGMLKIAGFSCRRFRVDVEGEMAEMHIWGNKLDEDAEMKLPAPLPVYDTQSKFTRLDLKPAPEPAWAPDPFIFPQPQEMSFGKEKLFLPTKCPLVLPPNASPSIRQLAQTLAENISSLVYLDLEVTDKTNGPAVWLTLASDAGIGEEVSGRRKLGEKEIENEGYAIEISKKGAYLVGRDERGLYYATRSLLFLMMPRKDGIELPVGYVRDYPRAKIRPAFAFSGWNSPFKRRLAIALATLKYSYLQGAMQNRELMNKNYLRYFIQGTLFPQSHSGTYGDLLEKRPGASKKALNPNRLSGCCSHPDYWKNTVNSWKNSMEGWKGEIVNIGYDEIFHNPFNVCARCRSRGISTEDILLDCYMKAYRYFLNRGFGIMAYATGFRQYQPFDMYTRVPTDSVITNYLREKENTELRDRGIRVIGGSTRAFEIKPDSPLHAGIVWNWGSEHPAAMFGEGKVRSQIILAEQNWSLSGKPKYDSPQWQARLNRAMSFVKNIVDVVPLPIPGLKYQYFTVDISSHTNRSLRDDVMGDGKGWLDEGPNRDMRHFPSGKQTFDDILFDLPIGDKRAIVVAGPGSADLLDTDQVTGIEINRQAAQLFFLHTCSRSIWTSLGRRIMLIGFYRIRYQDGTFITAEINYGQHIRPWTQKFGYREMEFVPTEQPLPDARVAWRGGTDGGHDITTYSMPWRNPYPEKPIASVDFMASAQAESNRNQLCLLGISGREVTEGDIRAARFLANKPVLRQYRARPELVGNVAPIDLTRKSPPPFPVPMAYVQEWETIDKWFHATVSVLAHEKSETNRGPYNVLNPDDDPWRLARDVVPASGTFTVRFKRLIPLHAVGVKGIMQRIRYPGFFPIDFAVYVIDAEDEAMKIGEVKGHIGQEGEERWVFKNPIKASGVEIHVTHGTGLSALYLYAPKGYVKPPKFKIPKMEKKTIAIGEEQEEQEEVTEEDVVDEFEGL